MQVIALFTLDNVFYFSLELRSNASYDVSVRYLRLIPSRPRADSRRIDPIRRRFLPGHRVNPRGGISGNAGVGACVQSTPSVWPG